jgi:hypothetical protein
LNNANAGCPILAVPFGKGGKNKSCREQLSIPPFAKNAKDPNFLYAAPHRATCAAFIKESRMEFVGSLKLNRKFGF